MLRPTHLGSTPGLHSGSWRLLRCVGSGSSRRSADAAHDEPRCTDRKSIGARDGTRQRPSTRGRLRSSDVWGPFGKYIGKVTMPMTPFGPSVPEVPLAKAPLVSVIAQVRFP